jgi:alkylation response protein AidB-like acyl-CoA dehydrogenase
MTTERPDFDAYAARCRAWLAERWPPRAEARRWGEGSDDVSVFHALSHDEELGLIRRGMAWQAEKYAAGYGAITWPQEYGGAGLTDGHARVFRSEEAAFAVPAGHEVLRITVNLAAPTINAVGTDEQRERFVRRFLGCEELCCQLFSEPGAGSDLAGLATRARPDGDGWSLNGAKVWASGAQFAAWGALIARTDPHVPKHAGLTAFLLPMGADGVEVRPIRQMTGGSSFNEVFLTDVALPDSLRLGDVGGGWKVALTMLGFERAQSGSKTGVGGSWEQLRALATWLGVTDNPVVRQRLMQVYTHERLREFTRERAEANRRRGGPPGPEGSLGKLLWTQGLTAAADAAALLLGPRLTADTGEWGTYAWVEHLLGAPGYRIAGGSDEIQRNIIAERTLGLPAEPGADRRRPWRGIPR